MNVSDNSRSISFWCLEIDCLENVGKSEDPRSICRLMAGAIRLLCSVVVADACVNSRFWVGNQGVLIFPWTKYATWRMENRRRIKKLEKHRECAARWLSKVCENRDRAIPPIIPFSARWFVRNCGNSNAPKKYATWSVEKLLEKVTVPKEYSI